MNIQDSIETEQESSHFNNRIQAIQQKLGETAKNVSHTTDEYVHDNPWTSVAIVAAVGVLIGFLIGNSRD